MKDIFKDIMALKEIKGALLLSSKGRVIFQQVSDSISLDIEDKDWMEFLESLKEIREAELIYAYDRIYIRRVDAGYILIWMTNFSQAAMVRLNCDILIPSLKKNKLYRKFL